MPAFFKLTILFLMSLFSARTDWLHDGAPPAEAAAPEPEEDEPEGSGGMSAHQEQIVFARSPHGYDRHEIHGQPCGDGYTRGFSAAMMSGSGLCVVEGWASEDPRDCRVRVRVAAGPEQGGVCYVTVYRFPM